ncbi:MAG: hypothetical protein NTY12_05145 [Candidatus Falkowbacteria bacterium]|nr:hypothetical protein [Candidatus Falkowbacteria bacterium]
MKQEIPSKIKEFLSKAGLDDKEVRVYVYLLSTGPQSASYIAKACGLTRTNAYDVIKKLESRGLCFNLGAAYGRKIKANPPTELVDILKAKEKEIVYLKDELIELLPTFKGLDFYRPTAQSQVSYFKGQESVRKLIRLSLQATEKDIRIAGSELDMIDKLGKEFLIDYHVRRVAKHLFTKALRPGKERGAHEVFKDDKKYLRQTRLRPEGLIRLKSIIIIWDSNIAFCSLSDDIFGTLIENEALAIMLKSWFDFVWSKSKTIS